MGSDSVSSIPATPIPVTVLGGYLGAGKTTLVNHLLRNAGGRRIAVMVNEFGALPIDADLIEGEAEDGIISLSGGCICCSYGSDLMDAMLELPARAGRPDHMLIEASGVALPGAVAGSIGLLADYRVDAVVVLADAETVRRQAADQYLGDTITRQLSDAHIVVATKVDHVSDAELASTMAWLEPHCPDAVLLASTSDAVPASMIFEPDVGDGENLSWQPADCDSGASDASDHLGATVSHHWHANERLDVEALAVALADPELGLLRAKGLVLNDNGEMTVVQCVGRRVALSPAPQNVRPGFVCIGLRDQIRIEPLYPLLGEPHHHQTATTDDSVVPVNATAAMFSR